MFDWIVAIKEWVFDGFGGPLVAGILSLVVGILSFLYKKLIPNSEQATSSLNSKHFNSNNNRTYQIVDSTVTINENKSRQESPEKISPNKKIQVGSLIIHQSSCGNMANLIFMISDKKLSEPYAKVTINTIKIWDFPNGETAPSVDFVVPQNDISCLLISPKIDASASTNITFTDSQYGEKELKVRLYTDHRIMDKHLCSYIGVTLFMLKITLSTKDFLEWTTTAIVQLAGGTAKTTCAKGITEVEFDNQKAAANEILQAVKSGANINGTIESKLQDMILT